MAKETTKPSWVESIPEDFGAAAAGTPKAAEWRTLFRLYLPLALISLLSQSASPHFVATVDNTMELVLALIVGCRGTTSRRRADSYRDHLRSYIEGLKTLYPNLQLHSIHHLAFHIHDFLMLFGPVPSWWCFPYERLIGTLQRTNHNHIFGELEATIHRTFVYSGALLRWLSRPSCPDIVRACKRLYDKVYAPKRDDFMVMADEEDTYARPAPVPDDLKDICHGYTKIILRRHFRYNRQVFSCRRAHIGNSLITYQSGSQSQIASIEYIYLYCGTWMFAVRNFKGLEPGPFAKWPELGASICSADMDQDLVPVDPQIVVHHVATYPLSDSTLAVVRLMPSVCSLISS